VSSYAYQKFHLGDSGGQTSDWGRGPLFPLPWNRPCMYVCMYVCMYASSSKPRQLAGIGYFSSFSLIWFMKISQVAELVAGGSGPPGVSCWSSMSPISPAVPVCVYAVVSEHVRQHRYCERVVQPCSQRHTQDLLPLNGTQRSTSHLSPPAAVPGTVMRISVCLSVLVHISKNRRRISPIFCACCLWPWLGPPLTALRNTLCTSGFVEDVTFSHNGLCGV